MPVPCPKDCGREFSQQTLDRYGGICRYCSRDTESKKNGDDVSLIQPVEDSVALSAPPPVDVVVQSSITVDSTLNTIKEEISASLDVTPTVSDDENEPDDEAMRTPPADDLPPLEVDEEWGEIVQVPSMTPHDLLDVVYPSKRQSVYQLIEIEFHSKHGYLTGTFDEKKHLEPKDMLAKSFGDAVITNTGIRKTDAFTYYEFLGRHTNGSFALFVRLTPEDNALINWTEYLEKQ